MDKPNILLVVLVFVLMSIALPFGFIWEALACGFRKGQAAVETQEEAKETP